MKKYNYATTVLLAVALIAPLIAGCARTVRDRVDDPTITVRVKTALLNDPDVGGQRIDVDTVAGVVTLTGAVRTAVERDRAVEIARRIEGVTDVRAALQIQP